MSKNGKLLFRGYDPYITNSFGYRVNSITGVNTLHAGVDYGTNEKNLPTYAIEDGEVVETGFTNSLGNYVYVTYPRLGKNGLYQHLDRISVKKNQKVTKDTVIGYTGATGEVMDVHLHFGWFNSSDQSKGSYQRTWEDFEKYDYIPPLEYLGTPVLKDENVSQIEIIINNLQVRNNPNGGILGYINPGIYNILDEKLMENYTWYKIGYNMWIAYNNEFANLYLKKEVHESKEDDSKILESDTSNLEEIKDDDGKDVQEIKKEGVLTRIFDVFCEFGKKILKKLSNL